jgi:hypothetical protein
MIRTKSTVRGETSPRLQIRREGSPPYYLINTRCNNSYFTKSPLQFPSHNGTLLIKPIPL